MKWITIALLALTMTGCAFHWVEPTSSVPTVTATVEPGEDEDPVILATPSCDLVKGNIDANGRKLYHLPGMPNYNQVKIDDSKGEKFFCSEQEAQDAGWAKAGG